jgi:hypothetical protein
LLIAAEDDARDTVQMIRYAGMVAEQGGKVVVECQQHLTGILSGALNVSSVIERGKRRPKCDLYTMMLSLPAAFGTTAGTIPASRPYLGARSELTDAWRERLSQLKGPRIGLALADDATLESPVRSSRFAMRATTSLLTTWAGNFIDLQFHASDSEHVSPAKSELLRFSSFQTAPTKTAGSSDNTVHLAAAVRNLDLLIAVDNVVAHMAAAMGVATWIILPISPEPRWLLNREDSPWYPTVRLYVSVT